MTPYEEQSLLVAKQTLFATKKTLLVAIITLIIAALGFLSPIVNLYSEHFASADTSKVEVKPIKSPRLFMFWSPLGHQEQQQSK